jgi:hypothetical protein
MEKANRDAVELADRLSGLELSTAKQLAELERERDEALKRLKDCGSHMIQVCEELEAGEGMIAVDAAIIVMGKLKRSEKENEEQARLLGMGGEREARLATERDHYKQALEEIATTIQEYKDSIVQEPSEDFIWAIKAWADKKLREI